MGVCGTVWEILKEFGRETSIAGLNNAAKARREKLFNIRT